MGAGLYNFFKYITDNFGIGSGILFVVLACLIGFMLILIKTFPNAIRSYYEKQTRDHIIQAANRKNISQEIISILSEDVINMGLKRALVFEYSNGTSNIAGLPFLYINATYEKDKMGIMSISQDLQRINTSLFATFISKLEEDNLMCFKLGDIEDEYPVLYTVLSQHGIKSAIYYMLYGVYSPVGFVCYEYDENDRDILVKNIADSAQRINLLLNGKD